MGPEPEHVAGEGQLVALRTALTRYERTAAPAALDQAFIAAAAAVAQLRGARADEPADPSEARELMAQLPEFERLVTRAVAEAERAAAAGAAALWEWFGLRSTPPQWDESERSGARVIVACACAPLQQRGAGWLRPRLLRLAARRWAGLLTDELRGVDEDVWRRALGDRYDSVRRRYAPRSRWRTRTLSALIAADEPVAEALRARLARWLAEDGNFESLAGELEAAFVQTRTPSRLA